MPKFLFQSDPIDGYDFSSIPIDIHLGIIKIPTKEILDDDAINNTESIIVGKMETIGTIIMIIKSKVPFNLLIILELLLDNTIM